jgi:hypothetical protein
MRLIVRLFLSHLHFYGDGRKTLHDFVHVQSHLVDGFHLVARGLN